MAGALAVAAHGAAGGGFPDSTDLALLLFVSMLTGWAAACGTGRLRPPWRGDNAHSVTDSMSGGRAALLGPLAFGQLAGHAVLSGLIDHSHGPRPTGAPLGGLHPSYVPTSWMLVAHLIATLGCVALILLAERLYTVASSVIRAVAPRSSASTEITGPLRWSNPGLGNYSFPPNGAIGPRAPPVSA
ncbi:hypothetical protein ACQP1G_00425 [Nocardia sp. CA-107356]|uniref:hypothetical protein n=1 Tax=Nocardia sp. CA-107356 TaxID=3239972 RepID=UPI003D8E6F47